MDTLIVVGCSVAELILVLLFIILFAKLKVSVIINNKIIKVYLYKIKVYDSTKNTEKTKKINKDDEFEKKYKTFKLVINFLRKVLDDKNDDLLYILKYIKKSVFVKKLDISLDYGFGDAALTGVTGGIIWGLISNICGFIGKYINVKEFTNIAVKPYYTEKILDFKVNFVFSVRILYLIKNAMYIKRFKNTLKGGN